MELSELKRDAGKVHACLQELPDNRLVAIKPVKIYVPVRFAERGLAEIGVDTYICGIYAIVTEDNYYAVSLVNAMIRIEPSSMIKVKFKGVEYFEFSFDVGSTIISTTYLVKNDVLVYRIYDEIIAKGRVPWYLSYEDMGKLFDSAKYHAGANIGQESVVTELIISLIARQATNKVNYFRTTVKNLTDLATLKPVYIPLKSVTYGATNTTNKLAGSYHSVGVTSALVSPSERVERIELLLRS
jgi:hypothetical protein